MGDRRPATVALVAHRLAGVHPTGIGRYYLEITRALAAAADPALRRYVAGSTREREEPEWLPASVERRTIGGPRKLRAAAWGLVPWPPVDGALGHPDLVHLLQTWAPVPTRAPLVATVHDLMPMLHPEWHGPLEAWSFRRSIRHIAEHARLVIAISADTAARLTEHAGIEPQRLRVVHLGVGDELRQRAPASVVAATCARHGVEPGRYLVTLGAVSERKNLSVVLRALARCDLALLGSVALLAVGPPGRGAAAIEAEAEQLGLADRVRFAGFVPDADLPVLLGASLALVHPSRDEGFGMTPLEAMAAGVPALAGAVGAVPEVVGAAAVLLDPGDPDAWAAAISRVAGDPDHRAGLVDAGTRHQATFTWARTAEGTRAVHDEVLGP